MDEKAEVFTEDENDGYLTLSMFTIHCFYVTLFVYSFACFIVPFIFTLFSYLVLVSFILIIVVYKNKISIF